MLLSSKKIPRSGTSLTMKFHGNIVQCSLKTYACLRSTKKTPEQLHELCYVVFIVDFEQLFRDRLQISLLILKEFEPIDFLMISGGV